MYVNVHVFVPAQGGSALGTPAEIVSARLQLSNTAGGIGAVAFSASNTTHSIVCFSQCVDAQCTSVHPTTSIYTVPGANMFNWGSDRTLQQPYVAFYHEGVGLTMLFCAKQMSNSIVQKCS